MLLLISITLPQLLLGVGAVAALLTGAVALFNKGQKNWLMSYLQNFTGFLFVFSGFVKAADPLGTAYKMEQYFTEFETTFEGTWMSFIAPMFPKLSEISATFSVAMVIFEIVLGLMLIMGAKRKLTSWLFFLLVAFFTFLTGFTYLTGYVPDGGNFFDFSSWAEYNKNNMKVTDCGCFGDFLKLEPKVSFLKDVFLLIPAIYFLFRWKEMHQLFTAKTRNIALVASTVLLFIYCISNFKWDIPHIDFRPFNIGKDVATQRTAELDAMSNVQIKSWILEHNTDGRTLELPNAQYMKEFQSYKADWKVVDNIQTEPTVKKTKLSDFEVMDLEGEDVTEDFLADEGYTLMIVAHKLKYDAEIASRVVQDTTYTIDTVMVFDMESKTETQQIVRAISGVQPRDERYVKYNWDIDYIDKYNKVIKPLADEALAKGIKVKAIMGGADEDIVASFKNMTGLDIEYFKADDILLKTIVRSNPGVVLWKDGKIVYKWHYKKLPSFDTISSDFIR